MANESTDFWHVKFGSDLIFEDGQRAFPIVKGKGEDVTNDRRRDEPRTFDGEKDNSQKIYKNYYQVNYNE